ncbi:HSP90 family protein [Plantibacter sp. CFBP 13570]|uniref:HSP90 family protein n=1 Tax=Plantibacter sp. CFBP 13570 TaxID=2775272 RepID=UPI001930D88E|nr:HSP90 family protein [Plantibacter sp. CFBP 13570]MBD8536807.1 HSP90 family protein [Plantibacter sp. CFBP 13570]
MPDHSRAPLPFQVDLRGVVDLLSRHIYSGPRVYLRELLQNGRDAVAARRADDPTAPPGRLLITPHVPPSGSEAGSPFRFRDDGVGLTRDEAAELLATVGRSSKRGDLDELQRGDYLGRFGIGLLSCFMVADTITVRSRSARGGPAIEWIGDADGTFTIRELDDATTAAMPIGSEVVLDPRIDGPLHDGSLLGHGTVLGLATTFGRFLDLDVEVVDPSAPDHPVRINVDPVFRTAEATTREALLAFGEDLLGTRPFDAVEIVVPGTGTRGTAFVLPSPPPPGARQASRVYLGGMLLSEQIDDLLPEWAFFVRCIVDTTGLRPTASREQLVQDDALEFTREAIGATLRRWILDLARQRPHRLQEFIGVHQLGIKAIAAHDDDLASAVVRWLPIETSAGTMTIDEHLSQTGIIRYTASRDEFRQIAAVVDPASPIVNGGYVYDQEILERLPHLIDGVRVERVTVADELDNLEPPHLDDLAATTALEDRASRVLAEVECRVSVRRYRPDDLAALYVADPSVLRRLERHRAASVAPGIWSQVVGAVDSFLADAGPGGAEADTAARLCLNWNAALVRRLATLDDDLVFERSIQLLYVQALLAGHRPLEARDRRMLDAAMTDLIGLSVGLDDKELR